MGAFSLIVVTNLLNRVMSKIRGSAHNSNVKGKSSNTTQGQSNMQLRELAKFLDEKWTSTERNTPDGIPYYSEKIQLREKVALLDIDRWLEQQWQSKREHISK